MMLTGLGITGTIYVLVSITAVALVPVGDLRPTQTRASPDPGGRRWCARLNFDAIFPFIGMFAVANSALINMLMASRLLYGLANQDVLPRTLGKVHPVRRTPWVAIIFTTLISFGLIIYVVRANASERRRPTACSVAPPRCCCSACSPSSTSPCWCCGAARRPRALQGAHVPAVRRRRGVLLPRRPVGAHGRADEQYTIAGGLLVVGIVLWALTWLTNRGIRAKKTGFRDIEHMEDIDDRPRPAAVTRRGGAGRPPSCPWSGEP